MKKRFFHISAKVIVDGAKCSIEKLYVSESGNINIPVADIRESIVKQVQGSEEAERITFLLNHIEEISEIDYNSIAIQM